MRNTNQVEEGKGSSIRSLEFFWQKNQILPRHTSRFLFLRQTFLSPHLSNTVPKQSEVDSGLKEKAVWRKTVKKKGDGKRGYTKDGEEEKPQI